MDGYESSSNNFEIDGGTLASLINFAFIRVPGHIVSQHIAGSEKRICRKQVLRRAKRIPGMMTEATKRDNQHRVKVALAPPFVLKKKFLRLPAAAKISLAQEMATWLEIPKHGLTIGWELVEVTDDRLIFEPVIKEINDHLNETDGDDWLQLQQALIEAFRLRPRSIPANLIAN